MTGAAGARTRVFLRGAVIAVLAVLGACARPAGTIDGSVSAGGKPVPDAEVQLFVRAGAERSGTPFAAGRAGRDGRFRLEVPPGAYYVVARKTVVEGGRDRTYKGESARNPVTVLPGRTSPAGDVALADMSSGGFVPREGTAATGAVLSAGRPAAGVHVYAYPADLGTVRGPSYVAWARTDAGGRFRIALREGAFALVARRKGRDDETGAMGKHGQSSGDEAITVLLAPGQVREVGTIVLHPAREDRRRPRVAAGGLEKGSARITGTVVREDGAPAAGVYVMAYSDHRMIGRPFAISGRTEADGVFEIRLPRPGRVYLGARSEFGGPVSPGEWVGTYGGSSDHSIDVRPGESKEGIRIQVVEKW